MTKSKNSGEETLSSIRRNSAYRTSRNLVLFSAIGVVFVMVCIAYNFAMEQQDDKVIILLASVILTGLGGTCFYHIMQAYFDKSDALIQVAKFQERSLRKRNDAISLVEKIRKEVEQEEKTDRMNSQNQLCEEKEIESNSSDLSKEPKAAG